MADTVLDQAPKQSDQVDANSSTREQPQVESQFVEINGEKLTLDEVKAGYMRTADYTKKTQELAGEKRALARNQVEKREESSQDDETTETIKALKQLGVVTREDLEAERKRIQAEFEDKNRLDALIARNPDLAEKRKALEAIGKNDNRAWEDIVVDYGFLQKDKVNTKGSILVGDTQLKSQKPKSISEMSDAEYTEWKKKNVTGQVPMRVSR